MLPDSLLADILNQFFLWMVTEQHPKVFGAGGGTNKARVVVIILPPTTSLAGLDQSKQGRIANPETGPVVG